MTIIMDAYAPITPQFQSSFKLLTMCMLNVVLLTFSLRLWSYHGMLGTAHSLTMLLTRTIRTSATNCARLYNTCIRKDKDVPYDYPIASKMTVEHVWDAFVLLALLEDCERQGTLLIVPHSGNQNVRFRTAMQARNRRIQASGYDDFRRHYCKKCTRIYHQEDGMCGSLAQYRVTGINPDVKY